MNAPGPAAMDIRFEPAAREYLSKHGDAVTLRGSLRNGCCGGTAFIPVAEPGPPREPDRYRTLVVDGVTVYIEAEMTGQAEPIVIGLDSLWRWQRLRVDGTAIRM